MKDTINMTRFSSVEIDFTADDPGLRCCIVIIKIIRMKASWVGHLPLRRADAGHHGQRSYMVEDVDAAVAWYTKHLASRFSPVRLRLRGRQARPLRLLLSGQKAPPGGRCRTVSAQAGDGIASILSSMILTPKSRAACRRRAVSKRGRDGSAGHNPPARPFWNFVELFPAGKSQSLTCRALPAHQYYSHHSFNTA